MSLSSWPLEQSKSELYLSKYSPCIWINLILKQIHALSYLDTSYISLVYAARKQGTDNECRTSGGKIVARPCEGYLAVA